LTDFSCTLDSHVQPTTILKGNKMIEKPHLKKFRGSEGWHEDFELENRRHTATQEQQETYETYEEIQKYQEQN
jgi:hypothetical protein